MRTVVGLGNPGKTYAGSRHNVGFAVVEELAKRWKLRLGRARGGVRVAQGMVAKQPARLVEPQMYMNLSGNALVGLDPPIDTTQLIVIHDDQLRRCTDVASKFPTRAHESVSRFTWTDLSVLDAGSWYAREAANPPEARQRFLQDLHRRFVSLADQDGSNRSIQSRCFGIQIAKLPRDDHFDLPLHVRPGKQVQPAASTIDQ